MLVKKRVPEVNFDVFPQSGKSSCGKANYRRCENSSVYH